MTVGLLELKIYLPLVHSLKEKRHQIQPLMNKLRHQFNISIAETEFQDVWQSSIITCAYVCSDAKMISKTLTKILETIETSFPNVMVESEKIEIL